MSLRERRAVRSVRALALALVAGAGALAFGVPVSSSPQVTPSGTEPAAPLASVLGRIRRDPVARNVSATVDQNEWNPRFSPDGRYLSFERRDGQAQAIFVSELAGGTLERVSSLPPQQAANAEDALLGLTPEDDSFNAQLSFFPTAAASYSSATRAAASTTCTKGASAAARPARSRPNRRRTVTPPCPLMGSGWSTSRPERASASSCSGT